MYKSEVILSEYSLVIRLYLENWVWFWKAYKKSLVKDAMAGGRACPSSYNQSNGMS